MYKKAFLTILAWTFWWTQKFWNKHGDRLIFATLAAIFGIVFMWKLNLKAEGKTILIGIAMLLYNKSRSPDSDREPTEEVEIEKIE
jgi:hypothetical protein